MVLSPATLGVYLIHEHSLVRNYIYSSVLHISRYFESPFYIAAVFLNVLIVFVVCICIEMLRIRLFGKLENRIIDFLKSEQHFMKPKQLWNNVFNTKCE
jgi:hypothetical protein